MDVEDLDDNDLFGARIDEQRGRPIRFQYVPGAVSDEPPLDPDLVEVAYGYHANGYKGGGYAYRTGGLKVRVGSYVMVPATSRSPRDKVATVVKIGSDYRGPTARLLSVHRHKHTWLRVCAGCGKREA